MCCLKKYVLILLLLPLVGSAQRLNGLVKTTVLVKDTIFLDSLSIVPNSVVIKGIDSSFFTINPITSLLVWKQKPEVDSIYITYRTLSIDFDYELQHKDYTKIKTAGTNNENPFKYTGNSIQNASYINSGLYKNGSISRGISFGNNQDLSVNSNLNLQLSGKVTENINVLAAITDDNIPIQAEGNTQQLQEFDKVYIQLFDESSRLTAGDFQLKKQSPYFLRYYKKAQGGRVQTRIKTEKKEGEITLTDLSFSAALSRGKFARNIIQGVEGNQGPYRLNGADNEQFIIILSGTERVYIDGKELVRGQENDYIIDYNTAQITFTAKRLITKDKRIVVEFQYSDKNYARSLVQFSDYYKNDKLNLRFDIYSEQDAKNQPLQQELSTIQKNKLTEVGDSIQLALASSVVQVEYTDNQILYKKIDTLGIEIYVVSSSPDSAIYRLSFSNVGIGIGSYSQEQSTANGKVFKWVGVGLGTYEPIILLVAPKRKQMMSLGGEYKFTDNTSAHFESAISNRDINTFSKLDAKDNTGYAFSIRLNNTKLIGENEEKNLRINSLVAYEQIDNNFNAIERFRSVEFYRDWNLRDVILKNVQHISTAEIEYAVAEKMSITYVLNSYISGSEFNALKNNLNFKYNNRGFVADITNSLMQSSGIFNSNYWRSRGVISKKTPWITIGVRDDFERNEFLTKSQDSLRSNSYQFLEWEAFVSNADSSINTFRLGYTQRENWGVKNNELSPSTFGKSLSLDVGLLKNKKVTLTNKTTYRVLEITDPELTTNKADSTLLNRLEYRVKLWKGAVISNSFFEIGSGLEIKKEFTYLKVADGQGVYIYNGNTADNTKDLNKFEIAPPSLKYQANYIKVFVPTNSYVKAFTNQFSQTLIVRPKAIWGAERSGVKKLISRFSNQLSYLVDRKTGKENAAMAYNPFVREIVDSILVSQNLSFRNNLNFNRSNPRFGAGINYFNTKNKTLLTGGFEQRVNSYYSANIRWNLSRVFRLNIESQQGNKAISSDFLTTRVYNIDYYSVLPKLTFQPGTTFRIALLYEFKNKQNKSEFNELAIYQKGGVETKYSTAEKGNITANLHFILINYDYVSNSSLSFEMLEGLQAGKNITWEIVYQRTLANNLQLNLNYNGRWAENSKLVHIGGVQVRAFF